MRRKVALTMRGLTRSTLADRIFLFICEVTVLILLPVCIDGTGRDSPTFARSSSQSGSWMLSTNEPFKQKDDDDSDEDDDDYDDDRERTNNVVVAAVPVVLGVVAIILLCIFMVCRQNNQRQVKCTGHRHRVSSTSVQIEYDQDILAHSSYEQRNCSIEAPTIEAPPVPSAPLEENTDLPPSYEEVMRTEMRLNKLMSPAL